MASALGKDALITLIIAALGVWILPQFISTYTLTVLVIYAMLALSLGLIWGFGGILCFGQAAFFGLGAYTYAISAINIGDSTLPMLLAIAVPFFFALILGALMFYGRLADVYLGVITLVVTLILYKFMNATAGPEYVIGKARLGGFNGIPGFPTLTVPGNPNAYIYGTPYLYFCVICFLIIFFLVTLLLKSSFGRIAIGIRENETRISLLGYDVRARKTLLFAIGGAIAGLAGALFANWGEIVTPNVFSMSQSAEIIVWCIVGGLGWRIGPVLGAMGLAYLKFALGQQSLIDNSVITGLILVVFVLLLPGGLAPAIAGLWSVSFAQKPFGRVHRVRRLRRRETTNG